MILYSALDYPQGGEAWHQLHRGVLTASNAQRLITPTGRRSAQFEPELYRVLAERRGLQEPEPAFQTDWMERGLAMESQAAAAFTLLTDLECEEVGFITDSTGLLGCSPDRLLPRGDDSYWKPLELKCPKPATHFRWLAADGIPAEHVAQVHMQLILCGAETGWFMSYCPGAEPLVVQAEWSTYTDALDDLLDEFVETYRSTYLKLFGEEI